MVAPKAGTDKSLCVIGFGNGNDLDLSIAMKAFESVTLVDIDGIAMRNGAQRQLGDVSDASINLVEADITGLADFFDEAREEDTTSQFRFVIDHAARFRPQIVDAAFDVVVSTCVLSQVVDGLIRTLKTSSAELLPVIQAVRSQHFATLLDLCKPGGCILLVTDFVSSDTAPELKTEVPLGQLIPQLIASHNFFTGLNPAVLAHEVSSVAEYSDRVASVRANEVWRWRLGTRVFAVAGIEMDMKGKHA